MPPRHGPAVGLAWSKQSPRPRPGHPVLFCRNKFCLRTLSVGYGEISARQGGPKQSRTKHVSMTKPAYFQGLDFTHFEIRSLNLFWISTFDIRILPWVTPLRDFRSGAKYVPAVPLNRFQHDGRANLEWQCVSRTDGKKSEMQFFLKKVLKL